MSNSATSAVPLPRVHGIPLLMLLIAGGLAGNYFSYPIFLNIDFLFGSIFAMLALQFCGYGRAVLAAALISSYTYVLWNQPYAIVIMTGEVALVGWLMARHKIGLVLSDALYWLFLGIPLCYFFYSIVLSVSPESAYIIMTKQAVNGIANALLARLIFTVFVLRSRTEFIAYRDLIYNLLAFFALVPVLVLLAVASRSDFAETDRNIRTTLHQTSLRMSSRIDVWAQDRTASIVSLSALAATLTAQQMQARLEQARAADPNFMRIGMRDTESLITAYSPLIDEQGQSNVGKKLTERPYIPTVRRTLKPMLTEVVMGRINAPAPIVILVAPVVKQGEWGGYINGVLSLEQIRDFLGKSAASNTMLYTLVDKNGSIILTNREEQKMMTPLVRGQGDMNRLDDTISQWVPALPPNTSASERWKSSYYVTETPVGITAAWKLVLEQPVAPFQKVLYARYADTLALLLLMLLGALALAEFMSRRVVATTERLSELTQHLPTTLEARGESAWPESSILEGNRLISNFRKMEETLALQFKKVRLVNESLEQRVVERTAKLAASERKLFSILEGVDAYIYLKDTQGRYLFANRPVRELFGAAMEHIVGKADEDFIDARTAAEIRDNDRAVLVEGKTVRTEETRADPNDGHASVYLSVKLPLRDETGEIYALCGISTDITERKRAEDAIKRSEQSLRLSEEQMSMAQTIGHTGSWVYTFKTDKIWGSAEAHRLFGYPADAGDFSLADIEACIPERERVHQALVALIGEGREYDLEYAIQPADGSPSRVIHSVAKVEKDAQGNPLAILGFIQDITERKNAEVAQALLETQLRESQKMEALGTLAGGVAHDFNNALAAILGNVELARQDVGPGHVALVSLEEISQASRRAKDLVQQILTFGRRQKLERKPTSLALPVVEAARLVRVTLPTTVSLSVKCDGDTPAVLADAAQIKQILLNLCGNAIQAMEHRAQGGVLTVNLSAYRLAPGEAHGDLRPGRYACLAVADNGTGMDEATRSRIFEPFFTTKPAGQGTGLGLSVIHGIVKAHEACIEVETAFGEGSTFRIYFPAVDVSVPELQAPIAKTAPVRGNGKHVLYVDDEEAIIFLMTRLLERQNYRVSGYTDPREALAAARANPDQFDLAVTDYNMPGMSGLEVASALREIRPDLPVVLASGYITEELRAKAPAAGVHELIYKPNTVDDLCEAVARCANAQSGITS